MHTKTRLINLLDTALKIESAGFPSLSFLW